MRTKARYEMQLPVWALPAIINDDFSGLSFKDADMVERFLQRMSKKGSFVVSTSDDTYFSWNPEFGLACDVVDAVVTILE